MRQLSESNDVTEKFGLGQGPFLGPMQRPGPHGRWDSRSVSRHFPRPPTASVYDCLATTPSVAVVILNWNGKEDTLECVASVRRLIYPQYKVVVVDNGSTDDSVDSIRECHPDITILQTGANLGYAGGNNVGIRWALEHDAEYVLVLNNDTVVAPDMLSQLVSVALVDPRIGLLGPSNFYYARPTELCSVGATLRAPAYRGYTLVGDGDMKESWRGPVQFDALVGSAMLIHRRVFEELQLFDERFFLCYEEFDFAMRAARAGYSCVFVPDAKIWHKVGGSLGDLESPVRTYFNVRNRLMWSKKHFSWLVRLPLHFENLRILRAIFRPSFSVSDRNAPIFKQILWAVLSWRRVIGRKLSDPTIYATALALRDYYLGRFGNCPEGLRRLAITLRQSSKPRVPKEHIDCAA